MDGVCLSNSDEGLQVHTTESAICGCHDYMETWQLAVGHALNIAVSKTHRKIFT